MKSTLIRPAESMATCAIRLLVENALRLTEGLPLGRVEIGNLDGGEDGEAAGSGSRDILRETILYVSDNSPDSAAAEREKLFAFYRESHPGERAEEAAQALAAVRRIAQRHQGRTWGEPKRSGGTVFFLALPATISPLGWAG